MWTWRKEIRINYKPMSKTTSGGFQEMGMAQKWNTSLWNSEQINSKHNFHSISDCSPSPGPRPSVTIMYGEGLP